MLFRSRIPPPRAEASPYSVSIAYSSAMRLPGACLGHGKPPANPCADNSSSFNYLSGVPKHPFRACASQTLHLSPFLHQNPLRSPLRLMICSCWHLRPAESTRHSRSPPLVRMGGTRQKHRHSLVLWENGTGRFAVVLGVSQKSLCAAGSVRNKFPARPVFD